VATTDGFASVEAPMPMPADVATRTDSDVPGPAESESFVTVLERRGAELVTVGQVGGLGRDERIFGVRFVGPIGYVVTFRQVDPLYTVDLGDPTNPTVRGELKILGYSAYLHPLTDALLLGVGSDATEEGRRVGAQVSVFDVSDTDDPRRTSQVTLPAGWTDAESEYKAFLWWEPSGLAFIPVQRWGFDPRTGAPDQDSWSGVVAFRVEGDQVTEAGRIAHPTVQPDCGPSAPGDREDGVRPAAPDAGVASASAPSVGAAILPSPWCPPYQPMIQRSFVIGERLYTLSDHGLAVHGLADLAAGGWLAW
jgi:hypothetical protein